MNRLLPILFLLAFAAPAWAVAWQDRDSQVAAATMAARQRLANDLADEPLVRGVTVAEFFTALRAEARFDQLIAAAQPVGGPRWIDDATCQVRVDLSARLVADAMLELALASPHLTPVPYVTLEQRLKGWQQRSFSATAGSVSWERAAELPPPATASDWRGVAPDARRAAFVAARDDAARRFVAQLETAGQRDPAIASLVSDEDRRRDLNLWMSQQPVTGVAYRPDRTVEVTLGVPRARMVNDAAASPALPRVVTGRSEPAGEPASLGPADAETAPAPRPAPTAPAEVFIPISAPDWAAELIDAEAVAPPGASPLKTARAAEAAAGRTLRDRIGRLAWGRGTIADAVGTDPAVSAAVDHAVAAARVTAVEYKADGSVLVRLAVPGRQIWNLAAPAYNRP